MSSIIHMCMLCIVNDHKFAQNLAADIDDDEADDTCRLDQLLAGQLHVLLENHKPSRVAIVGGRPFVHRRKSAFPDMLAYQADYSKAGGTHA